MTSHRGGVCSHVPLFHSRPFPCFCYCYSSCMEFCPLVVSSGLIAGPPTAVFLCVSHSVLYVFFVLQCAFYILARGFFCFCFLQLYTPYAPRPHNKHPRRISAVPCCLIRSSTNLKGDQGKRQERKKLRAATLEPNHNQTEPIGTERPAA